MPRWWHGSRIRSARRAVETGGSAAPVAPGRQVDRPQPGRLGDARDPAALGDRLAVDLLDVACEVDRRRAADVAADGVRVDRRRLLLEVGDPLGVQAARDDDLDVAVALLVEPRPDLLDEVRR